MFAAMFIPRDFELWYVFLCCAFVLKQMRRKNNIRHLYYSLLSYIFFIYVLERLQQN